MELTLKIIFLKSNLENLWGEKIRPCAEYVKEENPYSEKDFSLT